MYSVCLANTNNKRHIVSRTFASESARGSTQTLLRTHVRSVFYCPVKIAIMAPDGVGRAKRLGQLERRKPAAVRSRSRRPTITGEHVCAMSQLPALRAAARAAWLVCAPSLRSAVAADAVGRAEMPNDYEMLVGGQGAKRM